MKAITPETASLSRATARILRRCDALAAISSLPEAICRTYLSGEHQRANALVAQWYREAGLEVRIDAAGNVCGRKASAEPEAAVLILGSHLDTVPFAGRYDGVLGVLLAIEVARSLQNIALPFHLDVIGFGEEEGVRFGTTLMSSRACAGTWDPAWLALQDADGTTLERALRTFGLVPENVLQASLAGQPILGYLEAHIEQGPVLEHLQLPLAVVDCIAGAQRMQVTIEGNASHAGTTPMHLRRDALAASARAISIVEDIANNAAVVATVGRIQCAPNAVNVVPGRCTFYIDLRSGDDVERSSALADIRAAISQLCDERGLTLNITATHEAPACRCDTLLQQALAAGIQASGHGAHTMASGAGHDAMAMAAICPVGMLFIRSPAGVSHHPDESVLPTDVSCALSALVHSVTLLAQQHSTQTNRSTEIDREQ